MPELAQGPGRAAQTGGPPAEGVPVPPAPPRAARNTIVIERDGQKTVLENPTPEQLAQIGIAPPSSGPGVSGWQAVGLTGAVMWGIVAIVWLVLSHRRRVLGVGNPPKGSPDMDGRMARIENAIEAVAVEVERISEGQRFTTRMLSEGPALSVAAAAQGERVIRNDGEG